VRTGHCYRAGRLKVIVAAAALLFFAAMLALAGCGGSAATSTASPPTAASVARHLGCTGIQPTDPTYFAHSEVDATCQGHHADIATFKTEQLRDEWASFVTQTGGTVQTGELYAVGTGY
jgi:hypothetical protein